MPREEGFASPVFGVKSFCCSPATEKTLHNKISAKLFAKPGRLWCNSPNFLK